MRLSLPAAHAAFRAHRLTLDLLCTIRSPSSQVDCQPSADETLELYVNTPALTLSIVDASKTPSYNRRTAARCGQSSVSSLEIVLVVRGDGSRFAGGRNVDSRPCSPAQGMRPYTKSAEVYPATRRQQAERLRLAESGYDRTNSRVGVEARRCE